MEKGCVYFFKHTGLSPVKIGYSEKETPLARFESFKSYAPYGAEIIGFFNTINPKEKEYELHAKYSKNRLKGEWFEIPIDMVIKEIENNTSNEEMELRTKFEIEYSRHREFILNKNNHIEKMPVKKIFLDRVFILNEKFNYTKFAKENNLTTKTLHLWKTQYKMALNNKPYHSNM